MPMWPTSSVAGRSRELSPSECELRKVALAAYGGYPTEHGGAHRGRIRARGARSVDGVALQTVH